MRAGFWFVGFARGELYGGDSDLRIELKRDVAPTCLVVIVSWCTEWSGRSPGGADDWLGNGDVFSTASCPHGGCTIVFSLKTALPPIPFVPSRELDPPSVTKFNLFRFMISPHLGNISMCIRPSIINLAGYWIKILEDGNLSFSGEDFPSIHYFLWEISTYAKYKVTELWCIWQDQFTVLVIAKTYDQRSVLDSSFKSSSCTTQTVRTLYANWIRVQTEFVRKKLFNCANTIFANWLWYPQKYKVIPALARFCVYGLIG